MTKQILHAGAVPRFHGIGCVHRMAVENDREAVSKIAQKTPVNTLEKGL